MREKSIDDVTLHCVRPANIENDLSVAAALSLLAWLKPGRGATRRARDKRNPRGRASNAQPPRNEPAPISSHRDASAETTRRYWLWLDHAVVGLWIILLLSIIACLVVDGGVVMARLDGFDFVATHSLQP
ncbi:MAG: hypothetical protein M3023_02550 [Pseudomonadota bacterium]|nr:hypothetical protein [Pseudomonadota bacterium]